MLRTTLYILTLVFSATLSAASHSEEYELGWQIAHNYEENVGSRNRPYAVGRWVLERDTCPSGPVFYVDAELRLWIDFDEDDHELEVRAISANYLGDDWSLKVGIQEISWGEAFGFFILDIVNPRDLSDPLLNNLSWIRIPVAAINFQYFPDPWSLQLIVTPVPRKNLFPNRSEPFDVFPSAFAGIPIQASRSFPVGDFGGDLEYGARIGYLFESGLDANLYFYSHWNRNAAYELRMVPTPVFFLILERVNSYGLSGSYATESLVLRGDTVVHVNQPSTGETFGTVRRVNVWQTIVGIDYTSESGTTVGGQYHSDFWGAHNLHWLSIRYYRTFCEGEWDLDLFAFHGIDNHDCWVQPKLTWNATEHLRVCLRADLLGGRVKNGVPSDGVIAPFHKHDRVFLWLSYSY